jgi:2'-5' RNA ligase
MRLFVAVALPPGVRAAVAAACTGLGRELPPARWVAEEQLHVTLWFLGETDAGRLEPVVASLRAALAEVAPFEAELGGGGCYPPRGPARVAWIGVLAPQAWQTLAAGVRQAAASLGGPLDDRPFAPHVTVARPRSPWPPAAAERWRRGTPQRLGGPFPVASAALYRSELGRGGPRHDALAELAFGGRT